MTWFCPKFSAHWHSFDHAVPFGSKCPRLLEALVAKNQHRGPPVCLNSIVMSQGVAETSEIYLASRNTNRHSIHASVTILKIGLTAWRHWHLIILNQTTTQCLQYLNMHLMPIKETTHSVMNLRPQGWNILILEWSFTTIITPVSMVSLWDSRISQLMPRCSTKMWWTWTVFTRWCFAPATCTESIRQLDAISQPSGVWACRPPL